MSNKPTHEAYVVAGDGDKARWTKIGVAFGKNDGMTILLDAVPVAGRIVLRPVQPKSNGGVQ